MIAPQAMARRADRDCSRAGPDTRPKRRQTATTSNHRQFWLVLVVPRTEKRTSGGGALSSFKAFAWPLDKRLATEKTG